MLFDFISKLSIIKKWLGSDFERWRVFQECTTEIRQDAAVHLSVQMQLLKKLGFYLYKKNYYFYFDLSWPKLPLLQLNRCQSEIFHLKESSVLREFSAVYN